MVPLSGAWLHPPRSRLHPRGEQSQEARLLLGWAGRRSWVELDFKASAAGSLMGKTAIQALTVATSGQ